MYEKLLTFCYSCDLIGHGSNKCQGSMATKIGNTHPPFRVPQETAVGFSRDHAVIENPHGVDINVSPPSEASTVLVASIPDFDYGP